MPKESVDLTKIVETADFESEKGTIGFRLADGTELSVSSGYKTNVNWGINDPLISMAMHIVSQHKRITDLEKEITNLKERMHAQETIMR